MGTVILFILFIIGLGVSLGGMLSSNRALPHQYMMLSVAVLFLFLCYIGALIGGYFFSWLAIGIINIFIGITLIIFVAFLVVRFHPTLGYFHGDNKVQWVILFLLFLLIGMEFASLNISNWIIIIISAVFLGALMVGAAAIFRLVMNLRSHSSIVLLPAVLLVFLGIIKLI